MAPSQPQNQTAQQAAFGECLLRFGRDEDSAERLLATLQDDIRKNPPAPKHIQKIGSQVRQHSPMLIRDGRMLWHHGEENTGCKPVLDRLPETPTIGLCAVYMPTKSRRNERVADCPGDQVGGVFETVHLINGEENSRSKRWDDCVAKPPVGQSRFEWVEHPDRRNCRKALYDARYALHAKGIRDYQITGEYREERKEWSYREEFPKEWSLSALDLTWNDPWIVKRDTCRLTWDTSGGEDGTYRVGQCTQNRRRSLTYHWQQSRTSGRRAASPAVSRGAWRDVGGLDCPYDNFTTTETETGTYTVGGCTQRRQRTVTSHWRQSTRPGSTKQLVRKSPGKWRDVGQRDCPDRWTTWATSEKQSRTQRVNGCTQNQARTVTTHWRQKVNTGGERMGNRTIVRVESSPWRDVGRADCPYRYFTTTETETGTYRVNGCTQRRQRTVTSHWRQSARPGSSKQLRYKTNGAWRDVGRPNCPQSVHSSAVHHEYRTIAVGSCKQGQKRKVTRFYLTRADGTQEAGFPFSVFGRYTNVGGLFDCPKPVASTTVSTQTRSSCHQTTQESRHTAAQYTLFTYNRQVTYHWLTYADGRREAGKPPFTYGPWVRERQTRSCSTGSGGSGGGNQGESAPMGRGYDTDGDDVTDSTNPSGGHYGYSDSGLGAEASGGWTGGGFGKGEWSGSGNLGGGDNWSGGFGRGSRGRDNSDRGSDGWGNNSGESDNGGDPWGGLR